MKKSLSGLMALLLLLTLCAGCGGKDGAGDSPAAPSDSPAAPSGIYYELTGIDPQETVLEYDGNTIPAEMYFYWLGYSCSDVEYRINMYNAYYGNIYGDLVDENGKLIWDGALDDTTPAQVAKDGADSNVLSCLVLENMAKEYNVALDDTDKAEMEESLAQQIEQSGGEEAFQESLAQMGISRETFERISSARYLLAHLGELAADPSSDLYKAPSEEDNAYVDHILLMTVDSETREPLSEEEVAAKRATAEDLLSQLQAAGDVEALFNQLVEEYGEDPGRATDTGYLVTPQTNFVPEFLDAAFALQPGELSGIVESSYGYHILLRKNLTEDQLQSLTGSHLTELLNERMETALNEMVRSEKLDSIDAGTFYNGYMEIVAQRQAGDAAGDGGDSAGDGSVTPGSTDGTAE